MKGLMRALGVLLLAVAGWQVLVWLTAVPHFILPAPERVARSLWANRALLAENAVATYGQILLGLALGTVLGCGTAVQLALSPLARVALRPVLVFAQAIPVFALAPILTLWLGYGPASKVVMVVLVTYFPVASALHDGLMRMPQGYDDLARVMGAGRMRRLWQLQLPLALPALGSGVRLAAVAAPFGAVIGEWVGSSRGLGYLMLLANGRAQTDLMFAALVVLAGFTVALHLAVDRLALALTRRIG
ncbi:ABC transporter permease [Plastorhodobacter daqingensis]|uniref:ABC transporter permease n=1 Tax=Plastorhodobacter daqingensis TaxID=1387281 RepID=A0ABW2UKJ4_9RHOB